MSEFINNQDLEQKPFEQLKFLDFTEFRDFEDNILYDIIENPNGHQTSTWLKRTDSKLLFRPKDFYGPIKNIVMEEMEDPVDRIIKRKEDGFTMLTNYIIHPGPQLDRMLERSGDRIKGYYFIADAMRTGQGKIGQILAEEWFVPRQDHFGNKPANAEDELLHRYITKPSILKPEISAMDISNSEKFAIYRDLGKNALQNAANKKYFNY